MTSLPEQLADSAFDGDLAAVERLILQGAHIDGQCRAWTPLHAAIENNRLEITRCLISAGADLEGLCGGMTPLAHAVDVLIDGSMQQGEPIVETSMGMIDLLVAAGAKLEPGIEVAREYGNLWVENYLERRKGQGNPATPARSTSSP